MSNKERGTQPEPNQKPSDREPINNLWDQDSRILVARKGLQSRSLETLDELNKTGHALLSSEDPYQVKLGVQMLRMCLTRDFSLAKTWMTVDAPKMMQHAHPRVRHSSLWNVRTSVWFDRTVAPQALSFAKQSLNDQDPAVQRVAIWTHGDSVINDPQQFPEALFSINQFLNLTRKESASLFALEEFFVPLRRTFGQTQDYQDAVKAIIEMFPGYIGLKERAAKLLGIDEVTSQEDTSIAQQRLIGMTSSLHVAEMVRTNSLTDAINFLLQEMNKSTAFGISMRNTWLIREMLWLEPSMAQAIFSNMKESVLRNTDGDLIRTMCVVLGDCLLISPLLASEASQFVKDFYNIADNDGSQIVVAQTLVPLSKQSKELNSVLRSTVAAVSPKASNRSVLFTLQLLREDSNE